MELFNLNLGYLGNKLEFIIMKTKETVILGLHVILFMTLSTVRIFAQDPSVTPVSSGPASGAEVAMTLGNITADAKGVPFMALQISIKNTTNRPMYFLYQGDYKGARFYSVNDKGTNVEISESSRPASGSMQGMIPIPPGEKHLINDRLPLSVFTSATHGIVASVFIINDSETNKNWYRVFTSPVFFSGHQP
jgi:hypothetical protein